MTAPTFTHSLEPVTVDEGQTATFKVTFAGSPVPAVKWFRYSFPVADSEDFKILTTETSSSLTILKTCADDGGVFTCLLENIVGASKSSSNLNVMEAGANYVVQVKINVNMKLYFKACSGNDLHWRGYLLLNKTEKTYIKKITWKICYYSWKYFAINWTLE